MIFCGLDLIMPTSCKRKACQDNPCSAMPRDLHGPSPPKLFRTRYTTCMDDAPVLLTIRELARRLGVTARRARALAASGRVEGAVKVGRDWLIPTATRVAPGRRGPRPRAEGATQLVLGESGQGQALKQRRQRRFRELATQSPHMVRGAAAFRLPRQALHFEEPDLSPDELL